MRRLLCQLPMLTLAIASLAACGGGGVALNSTPYPPPSPTPTPTPSQTALVEPKMATTPPAVLATGATPSFASPGAGTTSIPLLMTAISGNYSGDQATVDQGAKLDVSAGGVSLVINNGALQTAGRQVQINADTLDYTRYGVWYNYSSGVGFHDAGVFAGGYQTPAASMPTSGSATYHGNSTFYLVQTGSSSTGAEADIGSGQVSLVANFAAGAVSGALTGFTVASQDPNNGSGAFNDLAFTASITPAQNVFSGTLSVTSTPVSLFAMPSGSTGTISGLFFGPNAQEVGGAWLLRGPGGALGGAVGTFGAKQ